MTEAQQFSESKSCEITFRFPHVDPAGIGFYPRYIELLFRCFPGSPIDRTPGAFGLEFSQPNRLGDVVNISLESDAQQVDWLITGRRDGRDCFKVYPLNSDERHLDSVAHHPGRSAFKTPTTVGQWTVDQSGCMYLSRFFETLNEAVEKWFEVVLEAPFRDFHFGRAIGIPTVRFRTKCRTLPRAGEPISMWVRPTKIGSRSMTITSWLVRDDKCLAEVEQTIVFVLMRDGDFNSIVIPKDIREAVVTRPEFAGSDS